LSAFYERLRDRAQRKRVRLLLDYLSRHETNLNRCLGQFADHTSLAVLDTWVQYVPDVHPFPHLESIEVAPALSTDDVIALALQLDDALIAFYRQLCDEADSSEVRDVFESMLRLEEVDEIALKRQAFEI
jgi:rubrerythrin